MSASPNELTFSSPYELDVDTNRARTSQRRYSFRPQLWREKLRPESVKGNPSEGDEEMLMAAPAELLGGLFDGLNLQREMTELLEELFYDGLS